MPPNSGRLWDQDMHNKQDCLAEMVVEESKAFFGIEVRMLANAASGV